VVSTTGCSARFGFSTPMWTTLFTRCSELPQRSASVRSPAPSGSRMVLCHPCRSPSQDGGDLRGRDPASLQRFDQRPEISRRHAQQLVPFLQGETPPPWRLGRLRLRLGGLAGLKLDPTGHAAVRAEFPGHRQDRPASPTRMRTTPRPPHRRDRQRFLISDPVPIPILPDRQLMGTSQMDTKTGEPLPALMAQDPVFRAIDNTPHPMTTGIPDPEISGRRQPETPPESSGMEDAQPASRLRRTPECHTPRHGHETNHPSGNKHPHATSWGLDAPMTMTPSSSMLGVPSPPAGVALGPRGTSGMASRFDAHAEERCFRWLVFLTVCAS